MLATVAGLIGIAHTLARRVTGPLLAAGTAGVGALVFVVFGGPWVAGKALAVGSPFVLLVVAIGCVDAVSGVRRLKRDALALAVAAAILASAVAVVAGVMVRMRSRITTLRSRRSRSSPSSNRSERASPATAPR